MRLVKSYDDFVKRGFSEDFVTISEGKVWWNINDFGCIQHKSFSGLSFMIDNQTLQ